MHRPCPREGQVQEPKVVHHIRTSIRIVGTAGWAVLLFPRSVEVWPGAHWLATVCGGSGQFCWIFPRKYSADSRGIQHAGPQPQQNSNGSVGNSTVVTREGLACLEPLLSYGRCLLILGQFSLRRQAMGYLRLATLGAMLANLDLKSAQVIT